MDIKITLFLINGQSIDFHNIINLQFTKERYSPNTRLTGRFQSDRLYSEVRSIILTIDGKQYHYGIPDKLEYTFLDGMGTYSFTSRGYSCALSYNQMTPGLYPNATISSLLRSDIVLPNVSFEDIANPIDYVFIKENDSMWDAACAFARKHSGDYPYIYGANTVRVTKASLPDITISKSDIVSFSQGQDYTRLLSHLHMRDLEGEYNTYNLASPAVYQRSILHHRHIGFDRQWLSDPQEAMRSVIDYSMRGMNYIKLCYCGFHGEELRQGVTASAGDIETAGKEISKLMLTVSEKGIFTTLWFYEDAYSDT